MVTVRDVLKAGLVFDTVSVAAPDISISETTVGPFVIGGDSLGSVKAGGQSINLGSITVPSAAITVPKVTIGSKRVREFFGDVFSLGSVRVPTVDVDFDRFRIRELDVSFRYVSDIDVGSRSVDLGFASFFDSISFDVPTIDIDSQAIIFGGDTINLGQVTVPEIDVNLPDLPVTTIGPFTLAKPELSVEEIEVPDPKTLDVIFELDLEPLAEELLTDLQTVAEEVNEGE